MKNSRISILPILVLMALSSALKANAQEGINHYRVSTRSTLHGVSLINNLDTYLSGYNYTGAGYTLQHETMRLAHTGSYQWTFQTVTEAIAGYAKLQSNTQLTFMASRYWSGYHTFDIDKRLKLLAGAQIELSGGALYLPTNSNNPVSAKLRTSIGASAMFIYSAPKKYTVRYRIDIPLAGLMFSPQYAQSYYEIFGLGDTRGIIKFTHPENSPSWRHTLTSDISIGANTLRLAYIANLYQSRVNNLRTHQYSHTFAVGFCRTIYKVKNNDPIKAFAPY